MQIEVLNIEGKGTGRSIELPDDIFGAEPNNHVIYLAVKQYLAAQRQGTNKVKTRAEVQGSSKKLHKQKGTGGSRKGNIRNPLYKGGGTIFGPKPRDYSFKLNKKVKDLAKISALSHKAKANAILVVEDVTLEAPKTKTLTTALSKWNVSNKKSMLILAEPNENIELSLRNVQSVLALPLSDINTYDIVNSEVLVIAEGAAKIFSEDLEEAVEA